MTVKKVLLYGTESTGKSMLAEQLAKHFETVFVPDSRRIYITKQDYCFIYIDLLKIALIHEKEQIKAEKKASNVYFIDTDAITLSIYSKSYFDKVDPLLDKIIDKQKFDLVLFTHPDVPWIKDRMRDYGEKNERRKMHKLFKDNLKQREIKYVDIRGNWDKRLTTAINAVNTLLEEE